MSCKSAIYTADPSSTVLTLSTAAGTAIPLGTTVPATVTIDNTAVVVTKL